MTSLPILYSKFSFHGDYAFQITQICLSFAEYVLKPLPFGEGDLEPFISETTITTHYNKHHAGYVRKLNAAKVESNPPLTQIIESSDRYSTKVVNLASQVSNLQCSPLKYEAYKTKLQCQSMNRSIITSFIGNVLLR